jgi:hypothetical protein
MTFGQQQLDQRGAPKTIPGTLDAALPFAWGKEEQLLEILPGSLELPVRGAHKSIEKSRSKEEKTACRRPPCFVAVG